MILTNYGTLQGKKHRQHNMHIACVVGIQREGGLGTKEIRVQKARRAREEGRIRVSNVFVPNPLRTPPAKAICTYCA